MAEAAAVMAAVAREMISDRDYSEIHRYCWYDAESIFHPPLLKS